MDTSKVYDVSEKQRKIAEWRDAKRKELRALYLKDSGHPTKTLLLDEGLIRYASAKTTISKFYMPTALNLFVKTIIIFGPIFGLTWLLKKSKGADEHRFRTGQVSYADRNPKFL
ncbi:hypothetical protein HN011_012048 [Eciton burchellii]|nr:hypothetical protein HN011_012048 [Eciton burchellii]